MKNAQPKLARIDSHQHFWQRSRGDYHWLTPDLGPIYQDFLPHDLHPELITAKIDKTVLIQATSTEAETNFMLNLAEKTDFVAGVIGWVDMESPDVSHKLNRLAQNPLFKGIRPMIQDISDDQWMLSPKLESAFDTLLKLDLCFDALVTPNHLKQLHTLLSCYPELKVVIDHGAKPDIASGSTTQWADDLAVIAKETQALCKLSGLITEAGKNQGFEDIKPYMEHLLECFGPKRLMWGSDWPVVNMAADYQSWVLVSADFISKLDHSAQASIWSETALSFYSL